jgi:fucose permease
MAIGLPPLLLANLADQVGVHRAYLLVPVLLVLLVALVLLTASPFRRAGSVTLPE